MPAKVQVPGPTTRFNAPSQYKILSNDWPYGVEPRIVHLCVWTKFDLEDDPETGFLQPWVIKEIDDFVARVFIREEQQHRPDNSAQYLAGRRGIEELVLNEQAGTSDPAMHIDDRSPREHVIWFKNWVSLKSIAALEHFHVMLFDPLPAFVSRITNGDVPVSQRLGEQRISQACRSSASNHPSQSRATSDQLVTS